VGVALEASCAIRLIASQAHGPESQPRRNAVSITLTKMLLLVAAALAVCKQGKVPRQAPDGATMQDVVMCILTGPPPAAWKPLHPAELYAQLWDKDRQQHRTCRPTRRTLLSTLAQNHDRTQP
jgi:hypothetical protein